MPINSWAQSEHRGSSNNIPMVLKRPSDYIKEQSSQISPKELEFIVAYKGYVNVLLQIQASETRKKLVCLGKSYDSIIAMQDGRLDVVDIEKAGIRRSLLSQIEAYKNSDECKRFLDEEVQKIIKAHSQMKAYLALHQSSPNEINAGLHTGMNLAGAQPLNCESMPSPLQFYDTQFCFQNLITLLDTHPDHILRSVSIPALDKVLGWALKKQKVPRVQQLYPLTWEEVLHATIQYNSFYTGNEFDRKNRMMEEEYDFDQLIRDGLSGSQKKYEDMIVKHHRSVRLTKYQLENYYWASQLQAQGTYVFSDYPENSAPRKYVEILSAHPVLAFYQPPITKRILDCSDFNIKDNNLTNLCEAYKTSYGSRLKREYGLQDGEVITYEMEASKVFPQLIKAYETVLDLNMILIRSLNMKYNSESLFVDTSNVNLQPVVLDVNNWSDLIGMDVSLRHFLETFPEHQGSQVNFVNRHERSELFKIGLQIGGAVGLGVACGFMGGWPLVGCLAAAGLGVNVYFYNDSLNRHNEILVRYFSTSTSETAEGMKLSLVDFEKMRSEVQGLYLDTLLIGVGLGVKQIGNAVRVNIRTKSLGKTNLN